MVFPGVILLSTARGFHNCKMSLEYVPRKKGCRPREAESFSEHVLEVALPKPQHPLSSSF